MTDNRPVRDPETGALKFDQAKPRVELLPARVLEDVADVLTFGADKYDDHNWRKGFVWSRMYGAALRHLFAWAEGENLDPESGLPHLSHAACCVLFLQEYSHSGAGIDDRWTGEQLTFDERMAQNGFDADKTFASEETACVHCNAPAGTFDGIDGGRPACVCDTSCHTDICRIKDDPEKTDQVHAGDYGKGNTEPNPKAWRETVPTAVVLRPEGD